MSKGDLIDKPPYHFLYVSRLQAYPPVFSFPFHGSKVSSNIDPSFSLFHLAITQAAFQLLGGLVHRLYPLGLCLGISSMCLFVTGTMIPNEVMYRGAQSSRLSFALFTACFDILWQQVCTFCHLASAQESCCRCIVR